MIDRDNLYTGLSHAKWGYVFLTFNLLIGPVNLLPQFWGFLLLYFSLNRLKEERRDLRLLRPLCLLLTAYFLADWLLSWQKGTIAGRLPLLDLLIFAATIYVHFQFLSDMAALAERYQPLDRALDGSFRICRNVFVVGRTLLELLMDVSGVFADETVQIYILLASLLPLLIPELLLIRGLHTLRAYVLDAPRELFD